MASNFHEGFSEGEIKPPSERSTGLVLGAAAAIIAILWRDSPAVVWTAGLVSAVLLVFSLAAPTYLKPVASAWFRLAMLLNRVMSPLIMFVIFALVFLPIGLIMQLRRDPLRARRRPEAKTYWIERASGTDLASSMSNQF